MFAITQKYKKVTYICKDTNINKVRIQAEIAVIFIAIWTKRQKEIKFFCKSNVISGIFINFAVLKP